MKSLFIAIFLLASLSITHSALAEKLAIKDGDTIKSLLGERKGKVVTLRLSDGGELTGKIHSITNDMVLLIDLSGRDYYAGIIELERVSAIIFRVQN